MQNFSKKEYREFLKTLCQDDCSNDSCILKEFLVRLQPSARMLVQIKCLYFFAKDQKKEVSRENLMKLWVEQGYANKFSEVFDNLDKNDIAKINPKNIYNKLKKE